ncbi:MAG: undecaprenyl-diphosphate phosphatase, partial [Myxococcota bacterium]
VPTAMAGLLIREWAEAIFGMPRLVAGMLLVTAALLVTARLAESKSDSPRRIGIGHALLIGLVQGIAIVPGISRSGSTIAVALLLGLGREEAARFSFLLAVPAILGALLIEILQEGLGGGVALWPLVIGFATAGVLGLAALAIVVPLVRSGCLHYFAVYLVPVGMIGWVTLP